MNPFNQDAEPSLPADFDHVAEAAYCKEAIETIVNDTPNPGLFLVNRARHPEARIAIPKEMLAHHAANFTGEPCTLVTTLRALDDNRIVLGPRHRANFKAGAAVLFAASDLELLAPRVHGGQEVGPLKEQARDGLSVVVVLATETVRALLEARDHKNFTKPSGRYEARQLLPQLELSLANLFDEGQKLLSAWYSGRNPREVMTEAYITALAFARERLGKVDLGGLIDDQARAVEVAAAVYARVEDFQRAHHGMSDENRHGRAMTTFQQQELANARQEYLPLDDLMKAAIAMNFNPSQVFLNFAAYHTEFDVAALLGRLDRGFEIELDLAHLQRLERLFDAAERCDSDPSAAGEEELAGVAVRKVALRYDDIGAWRKRFVDHRAIQDGVILAPKAV